MPPTRRMMIDFLPARDLEHAFIARGALENNSSGVNMTPANPGGIAQLVERFVRNEEARGSNPLTSTNSQMRNSIGMERHALVPVTRRVASLPRPRDCGGRPSPIAISDRGLILHVVDFDQADSCRAAFGAHDGGIGPGLEIGHDDGRFAAVAGLQTGRFDLCFL